MSFPNAQPQLRDPYLHARPPPPPPPPPPAPPRPPHHHQAQSPYSAHSSYSDNPAVALAVAAPAVPPSPYHPAAPQPQQQQPPPPPPPPPPQQQQPPLSAVTPNTPHSPMPPTSASSAGPSQPPFPPPTHPHPSTVPISTPLTRDFPSTAHLTRQELHQLLQDESDHVDGASAGFEAFVRSLPEIKARFEQQRLLREQCEQLAEKNLQLRPRLEALRSQTQADFERAKALEREWPVVEARQREEYKRFTPSSLHAALVQSLSRLNDESESLASAYVEGLPLDTPPSNGVVGPDSTNANRSGTSGPDADAEVVDFVRRYRSLRQTYHRRSIVAERWSRGSITWRDE